MFFFSGTGNARNVARWMVEAWRERHLRAEAIDIAQRNLGTIEIAPDDEIGLVSPTHGFNLPPITMSFLFAFPRTTHRNRAFVMNTRAGVRLFGLFVPGLSGATQLLAALVLLLKGYRVVGMRPIDLPSNWISVHPGLRDETVRAIYERCRSLTQRCARRLLDRRRDYRALWDLPQDLLVAPIALGYYVAGRFLFAKSFVASAACDACGSCIKQCPLQAIRLVDGRPFWSYRCESCMRCMNQCPKRAIETAHGFILGFLLLLHFVMLALAPLLGHVVPVWSDTAPLGTITRWVFQTAIMLSALFVCYRLLHRARRFRLVERLTVLTSLTHFPFWRRYRAPGVAQGPVRQDDRVGGPPFGTGADRP